MSSGLNGLYLFHGPVGVAGVGELAAAEEELASGVAALPGAGRDSEDVIV